MNKLLRRRNVVIAVLLVVAFLSLQVCLLLHTISAKIRTAEYLGRGVCSASWISREEGFYPNGRDRCTFQIPPFEEEFRMHTASFEWNDNRYVPPDANTTAADTWVGTCTLTPKSPWRILTYSAFWGRLNARFMVIGTSNRTNDHRITKGCTRSTHSGGCEVVGLSFVPGEPRRYRSRRMGSVLSLIHI